ncbi:DUF5615 family PIN-like protein [Catalinimonas sp. 4WD22]|uniref:DUF5615 family PIN-like protein n=1 Tax=Catalinimonas locisalis TaxID=3133978 RepID=UPI0031014940
MKFLANENIPLASIFFLRELGFDVQSIGLDNPSIFDAEVMNIAIKENRTIITHDSDYGELIFKHGFRPKAGVIYIRMQPSTPLETAKIVEDLVGNRKISLEHALTVVDANGIRQKKY